MQETSHSEPRLTGQRKRSRQCTQADAENELPLNHQPTAPLHAPSASSGGSTAGANSTSLGGEQVTDAAQQQHINDARALNRQLQEQLTSLTAAHHELKERYDVQHYQQVRLLLCVATTC